MKSRANSASPVAVAWDFTESKDALDPGVNKKVSYTQRVNKTLVQDVLQQGSVLDPKATAKEAMSFYNTYSAIFGTEQVYTTHKSYFSHSSPVN